MVGTVLYLVFDWRSFLGENSEVNFMILKIGGLIGNERKTQECEY